MRYSLDTVTPVRGNINNGRVKFEEGGESGGFFNWLSQLARMGVGQYSPSAMVPIQTERVAPQPKQEIATYDRPTYIKEQQCAKFQNDALRAAGYDISGSAWNLNNVKPIYSGYDESIPIDPNNSKDLLNYGRAATENVRKNFDSKTQLDKNKTYVVNMYYKGSPYIKQAFAEGHDYSKGTHTGYLTYNPNSKRWEVTHNVHGKVRSESFIGLQNNKRNYGVTSISEVQKPGFFSFLSNLF